MKGRAEAGNGEVGVGVTMVVEGEGADPFTGAEPVGEETRGETTGPRFHLGPAHLGGAVRGGRDQAAQRGDGPGAKGEMFQQESAGWDHGVGSEGGSEDGRDVDRTGSLGMSDDNPRSHRSRRFIASTGGPATNSERWVG